MAKPLEQGIAEDLHRLGVVEGGSLLVHSSLRSLGYVEGGPMEVVAGLRRAVGPEGTLLLPALSYDTVTAANPVFDLEHSPSCVGAITECFRTSGAMRSIHPTHSVCAVGPDAADFLADHHRDTTPVGEHSPFRRIRDRCGQILMLGCGLKPNTSMHGVEERLGPRYLFEGPVTYTIRTPAGGDVLPPLDEPPPQTMTIQRHGFAAHGCVQRYDRLKEVLSEPALRRGQVLDAEAWLIDARLMWEAAEEALRDDELFFVDVKSQNGKA